MTVKIRKGLLRLWFAVPTGLVVYGVCKGADKKQAGGFELSFGKVQQKLLKQALKQAKKQFGKLEIVSVKAADGTTVKIKL